MIGDLLPTVLRGEPFPASFFLCTLRTLGGKVGRVDGGRGESPVDNRTDKQEGERSKKALSITSQAWLSSLKSRWRRM